MSNHLRRDLAPVSDTAWAQIDDEARERLTAHLAARRLVDWGGPHGWGHSATELGRTTALESGPEGTADEALTARRRRVLPLAEIRIPFTVERTEVEDAERGAQDLDLDDLCRAARQAARVENRTVFHGWSAACMRGITEMSAHQAGHLGTDAESYPSTVATAVDRLREAGIAGPYALAIGPAGYTRILETTEHGGCLLLDHLRRVLGGGSVVRTIGLDGAVVLRVGGGDFQLQTGQDFAIGYRDDDADTLHLYLEQSFSFHVTEPDAAVVLND